MVSGRGFHVMISVLTVTLNVPTLNALTILKIGSIVVSIKLFALNGKTKTVKLSGN